jgi:hypothetical protein
MLVRSLLLFCACSVLFSAASAQKIKSASANLAITSYPTHPLPAAFKTYAVIIEDRGSIMKDVPKLASADEVVKMYSLERQQQVADLNIHIIIPKFRFSSGQTVIGTLRDVRSYAANTPVEYIANIEYEVTDSQGIIILKETISTGYAVYSSRETPPQEPKQTIASEAGNSVAQHLNWTFEIISERVANAFDHHYAKYKTELYTIKASKTESYQEYTDVVNNLSASMKAPASLNTGNMDAVRNSINFWETKLAAIDQSTEEGKDHHFLCLFNLSVAYMLLDEFDKSNEYADKAVATTIKSGATKSLKEEIQKRRKRKEFYLAGRETVSKDPTQIFPKGMIEKTNANFSELISKQEKAVAATMEPGFIVLISGDTLFGRFISYDMNRSEGQMQLLQSDGKKESFTRPYTQVKIVSVRGATHYCHAKYGLLKISYGSPTLILVSNQTHAMFIFTKSNKEVTYPLFMQDDAASFIVNRKKKIAEIFQEVCPAVAEDALKGTYTLTEPGIEPLLVPIKDYETRCGSNQYDANVRKGETGSVRKLYR